VKNNIKTIDNQQNSIRLKESSIKNSTIEDSSSQSTKSVFQKKKITRLKSLANVNFKMKFDKRDQKITYTQMEQMVKKECDIKGNNVMRKEEEREYQRKFRTTLFSKNTMTELKPHQNGDNLRSSFSNYKSIQQYDESDSETSKFKAETDESEFINEELEDLWDDLIYYIRRGSVNASLNERAIKILEEWKFHPNEEIKYNGNTLMHFSAEHGNINILKQLIKRGGSPYVENLKGEGIMHLAAREGHLDYIEFWLPAYEMDIDQVMNDYWTPLFYACLNNHLGVIEYLINKKADINHVDKFLRTPLHWATKSRWADAVELLLAKGAKFELKDIEGKKAEDMNEGYDDVTQIYIDFDAKRQLKIKKELRNIRKSPNRANAKPRPKAAIKTST